MGEEITKPACRAFRMGQALMVLLFAYPGMLVLLEIVGIFGDFPEWFIRILRMVYTRQCISAYAMTVVAFGIWLGVRIINRRERWAKWMAGLLVGSCVGYPLSYGPVYWLLARGNFPEWGFRVYGIVYCPLVQFLSSSEMGIAVAEWYGKLWMP
jgi:hypothetical protein